MRAGRRAKNKNNKTLFVISIIFIGTCIISGAYIINWYINGIQNRSIEEKIKENVSAQYNQDGIYDEKENYEEVEYKIDFQELKKLNKNTVSWLKVYGTDIEHIAVQTNNNSYYLTHNFENKYNVAGWIFVDYRNKLDGTDKNIIVYGHNMLDGSMFGTLTNVLEKSWYNNKENHIIEFVTEKENAKYQVFSVYKIEPEDYYITTKFTENTFVKYINTVKARSIKDFDIEVTPEDKILTLSTCDNTYTQRIVLHAKKI